MINNLFNYDGVNHLFTYEIIIYLVKYCEIFISNILNILIILNIFKNDLCVIIFIFYHF